jgi:hypothetical protein
MASTAAPEIIAQRILLIRGQKVILDAELAELYGVPTKRLNEQVKRNSDIFPEDFMFQLTAEEFGYLRSQFATSSAAYGGDGVEFAAGGGDERLRGARLRQLREMLSARKELATRLDALERKAGQPRSSHCRANRHYRATLDSCRAEEARYRVCRRERKRILTEGEE